jgi:hypothetical protein
LKGVIFSLCFQHFYIPQNITISHFQPTSHYHLNLPPFLNSIHHYNTISSTLKTIEIIKATIEEIKLLPPVPSTANPTSLPKPSTKDKPMQRYSHQGTSTSNPKPSVRTVAPGWGYYLNDIEKKDAETHQDRLAKATAFAASGEKHTINEVYKESKAQT